MGFYVCARLTTCKRVCLGGSHVSCWDAALFVFVFWGVSHAMFIKNNFRYRGLCKEKRRSKKPKKGDKFALAESLHILDSYPGNPTHLLSTRRSFLFPHADTASLLQIKIYCRCNVLHCSYLCYIKLHVCCKKWANEIHDANRTTATGLAKCYQRSGMYPKI